MSSCEKCRKVSYSAFQVSFEGSIISFNFLVSSVISMLCSRLSCHHFCWLIWIEFQHFILLNRVCNDVNFKFSCICSSILWRSFVLSEKLDRNRDLLTSFKPHKIWTFVCELFSYHKARLAPWTVVMSSSWSSSSPWRAACHHNPCPKTPRLVPSTSANPLVSSSLCEE